MDIYDRLRNGEPAKEAIILMPIWNYELPYYAEVYMRPAYELIYSTETLIEFTQWFLVEYSESNNEAKKRCIEKVVFPIYRSLTGRNFDANMFQAFGLIN